MVSIKVGDVINLNKGLSGTRQDGKTWYIAADIKPDKGNDRLTVFAVNADDAVNFKGNKAKITRIDEVIRKTRKYNERYYVDVNAMCVLEEIVGYTKDELESVDDSELPFM